MFFAIAYAKKKKTVVRIGAAVTTRVRAAPKTEKLPSNCQNSKLCGCGTQSTKRSSKETAFLKTNHYREMHFESPKHRGMESNLELVPRPRGAGGGVRDDNKEASGDAAAAAFAS